MYLVWYWDKTSSGSNTLTQCITVAVLGHYCISGKVVDEYFNFKPDESWFNSIEVFSNEEIYQFLICHFSLDGGAIIDVTNSQGI